MLRLLKKHNHHDKENVQFIYGRNETFPRNNKGFGINQIHSTSKHMLSVRGELDVPKMCSTLKNLNFQVLEHALPSVVRPRTAGVTSNLATKARFVLLEDVRVGLWIVPDTEVVTWLQSFASATPAGEALLATYPTAQVMSLQRLVFFLLNFIGYLKLVLANFSCEGTPYFDFGKICTPKTCIKFNSYQHP